MKWARAKTIFIYIFIFVNIFLFVVYRMNSSEGKQISTRNVISVLKGYNILAEGEVFEKLPVRMKQVEALSIAADEAFLKSLMGKKYENNNGVITSGTKALTSEAGNSLFTDSSPENRKFSGINKHNASGKIIDFLASLGVNKKNLRAESITESKDGKFGVVIGYAYEKQKVFSNGLFSMASEKGVEKISGPFLEFKELENRYYYTLSPEEVLIDYLSLSGNISAEQAELSEVNCGYFVSGDGESVSSYAIPAYEFVFSGNKTLYLDARQNIEPEFKLLSRK